MNDVCPICFKSFKIKVRAKCTHSFCYTCISQYMLVDNFCPICMKRIEGINYNVYSEAKFAKSEIPMPSVTECLKASNLNPDVYEFKKSHTKSSEVSSSSSSTRSEAKFSQTNSNPTNNFQDFTEFVEKSLMEDLSSLMKESELEDNATSIQYPQCLNESSKLLCTNRTFDNDLTLNQMGVSKEDDESKLN